MSQQLQSPQGTPMQQYNPQMGTQFDQQQGQQMGRLSQQQRNALVSVGQAIEVCEWCADRCVKEGSQNMIECIELCEDVSELGETVFALLPRNSRFGPAVVQSFQQALQACAQECGRHQHAHCQECARTLQQVIQQTQSLAQSGGQQMVQSGAQGTW